MPGRIEYLSFCFDAFEDILYFLVELVELMSVLISEDVSLSMRAITTYHDRSKAKYGSPCGGLAATRWWGRGCGPEITALFTWLSRNHAI